MYIAVCSILHIKLYSKSILKTRQQRVRHVGQHPQARTHSKVYDKVAAALTGQGAAGCPDLPSSAHATAHALTGPLHPC